MANDKTISPVTTVPEESCFRQWAKDCGYIFRAFRIAIEPGVWVLALLALVIIYTAGRAVDGIWGPQVLPGEISAFHDPAPGAYREMIIQDRLNRQAALAEMLQDYATPLHTKQIDALEHDPRAAESAVIAGMERQFHRRLADLAKQQPALSAHSLHRRERRLAMRLLANIRQVQRSTGRGIFDAAMHEELKQFHALAFDVLNPLRIETTKAVSPVSGRPTGFEISVAVTPRSSTVAWQSNTVLGCLANMFITVPAWLVAGAPPMIARESESGWRVGFERIGYLLTIGIFFIICVVLAAMVGGTVCRYTALRLAGEDPSMLSGVLFAVRRFWFFIRAPLLPIGLVVVLGAVMMVISLIGAIPWIGPILLGLLFIVLVLGGFMIMLVVLGFAGGLHLIYPCLSVEVSDGFDAISRSFSYVYNRPWRTAAYTMAALVYGVLTWFFLLVALYVLLATTHFCANAGMSFFGLEHGDYSGFSVLETIWRTPHLERLIAPINWWAMGWGEWIAAIFIYFWLFLLVTLLGAYVVAYYFASSTIIYLLLRRHVDGQPINDIAKPEDMSAGPALNSGAAAGPGPGGTS
jgi:hypothetical protein